MYREEEIKSIDDLQDQTENDRLLTELVDFEKWPTIVHQIIEYICDEPGWLLDENIFSPWQIQFNTELLEKLRLSSPSSLDDITAGSETGKAILFRFMEIFSEQFGFDFVYRGGSLEDLNHGIRGTYTFFFDSAKGFILRSYSGKRKDPCLIALPVSGLVEYFKQNTENMFFIAEHGYDGVFNASFDIGLRDYFPDEMIVYILNS